MLPEHTNMATYARTAVNPAEALHQGLHLQTHRSCLSCASPVTARHNPMSCLYQCTKCVYAGSYKMQDNGLLCSGMTVTGRTVL